MTLIQIHYSINAKSLLTTESCNHYLPLFKIAGITTIWLHGYFFGHWESTIEEMVTARTILIQNGFDVGVINIPVGHPGNSLDPDDPSIILSIPSHWRYRIDRHGNLVHFCADIDEVMIKDNVIAMQKLKEAGFTMVFVDDDTRQGNWGTEIQGCFCDACITEFNRQYQQNITRSTLNQLIELRHDSPILQDWVRFNCEKITRLLTAISLPGMQLGLMVMHLGDERHGIDLHQIHQQIPSIWIRVGENHFDDRSFIPSKGKASEFMGIQTHLHRIIASRTFSETTDFPPGRLTPENWAYKAQLSLIAGIDDIFLMNGLKIVEDRYLGAIHGVLPQLQQLKVLLRGKTRVYPLHICYGTNGTHSESIFIPLQGILGGLPSCPVRAQDLDFNLDANNLEGTVLLVLSPFRLGPEWQDKLLHYREIWMTSEATQKNPHILSQFQNKITIFPSWGKISIRPELRYLQNIRAIIKLHKFLFPYIIRGINIGLVWIPKEKFVIVFNLHHKINTGIMRYGSKTIPIRINPLEFQTIQL